MIYVFFKKYTGHKLGTHFRYQDQKCLLIARSHNNHCRRTWLNSKVPQGRDLGLPRLPNQWKFYHRRHSCGFRRNTWSTRSLCVYEQKERSFKQTLNKLIFNETSNRCTAEVIYGIPQGSVLGPMLFTPFQEYHGGNSGFNFNRVC